MFYEYEVKS